MEIVLRELSSLTPYENNPRINDHVVQDMIDLIDQFGFTIPMLIRSSGEIVDGHLRFKAATQMGLTEVPAIIVDHLSEAQVIAFRMVVNKSVSWAEWDHEKVKGEFEKLQALNFDLNLTGFRKMEQELILKGWDSDLEALKKIDGNERGIDAKITMTVPQEMKGEIKEWLEGLIAGSDYEPHIKLS